MTQEERRAIGASWRALHSTGEEQCRALDRLAALAGDEAAFKVWLMTKPSPMIVQQVIRHMVLRWSPLFNVLPVEPTSSLSLYDTVKIPRLEV